MKKLKTQCANYFYESLILTLGLFAFYNFGALSSIFTFSASIFTIRYVRLKKQKKSTLFIEEVQNFTSNISGSVDQLTSSCSQLSTSNSSQVDSMKDIANKSKSINMRAHDNANNLKSIKGLLENIDLTVEQGQKSSGQLEKNLQQTESLNHEVLEMISFLSDKLFELNEQFDNVSIKTGLINDIVFQTKLLSFNASVEAARAGEHGKGFSVVAQEIGNLAKISGESALSIDETLLITKDKVLEIIDNIKNKNDRLLELISSNSESVKQIFKEFSQNFDDVAGGTSKILNKVRDSYESIEMQASSMNEMSRSSQNMNESLSENYLVVEQTSELGGQVEKELLSFKDQFNSYLSNSKFKKKLRLKTLPWSEKYCLKIEKMDKEHKALVDKINNLIMNLNKNEKHTIKNSFNELKVFTLLHFENEEQFMRSFDYDSYESHKKVHENLVKSVLAFEKDIESNCLNESKLIGFLKNWLFTHIVGVDAKYAQSYFKNRNKSKIAS